MCQENRFTVGIFFSLLFFLCNHILASVVMHCQSPQSKTLKVYRPSTNETKTASTQQSQTSNSVKPCIEDPKLLEALEAYAVLDLSGTNLNSTDFNSFTKEIAKDRRFKSAQIQILDLSNTPISCEIAEGLTIWLQLKKLEYIIVVGTPLSLKNVGVLAVAIRKQLRSIEDFNNHSDAELKKTACKLLEKIIFISKSYVSTASSKVQIYKKFVRIDLIPSNWAELHSIYYASDLYNAYIKQQKKAANATDPEQDLHTLYLQILENEFRKMQLVEESETSRLADDATEIGSL